MRELDENEKHMYLSNAQYLELLLRIKETINQPGFTVNCYDSTEIGNKYTESNCGLCNDEFTTKETAMFPEYFPSRKDMKYRKDGHRCPFDTRESKKDSRYGCFYHCYLFKNKKHNINHIKAMVDTAIAEATKYHALHECVVKC